MICDEDPCRRRPGNRRPGENDRRGLSEWRKIWASGVPNESRSPNSGYRTAAKGIQPPWRWDRGMISTNLGVIWEMSGIQPSANFPRRPNSWLASPHYSRSYHSSSLTPVGYGSWTARIQAARQSYHFTYASRRQAVSVRGTASAAGGGSSAGVLFPVFVEVSLAKSAV